MKTVLKLFFAVVVFVGAVAGAYQVKMKMDAKNALEASTQAPLPTDSPLPTPNKSDAKFGDPNQLPVAVRPKSVSVEELLRLSMSLKEREKKIAVGEEKLREQSIQQKIAFTDVEDERKQVDALRSELDSHLKRANDLVGQLHEGRQAIIDERSASEDKLKEIEDAQIEIDSQHQENTKKLSQWIQSMDSEKAAEVLREMANDGNMEMAVQILAHFEERDAAKILSSLDDAKLVQDFVSEFRNLKRPVTAQDERSSRRR